MGGINEVLARGVNPITIDPYAGIREGVQIQAQQQEAQIRAQQSQGLALENQQRQTQINDSHAIAQLWGKYNGNVDQMVQDPQAQSISPAALIDLQTKHQDLAQHQATTTKLQQDVATAQAALEEKNTEHFGDQAIGNLRAGLTDPASLTSLLTMGAKLSPAHAPQFNQMLQAVQAHPENSAAISQQLVDAIPSAHAADLTDKAAAQKAAESAATLTGKTFANAKEEREAASRDLGNVTDQASYDAFSKTHPAIAQTLGPTYDQGKVQRFVLSSIPPEKQPEYLTAQAKLKGLQALLNQSGEQLDSSIDQILKPGDPLNAPTKAAAHAAAARGDAAGLETVLNGALQHRSQVEVAKENKQNALTIDMSGGQGPQPDAAAQGIAHYQMAPLSSFAMARPAGQALMAKVMQINPQYHAEYYNNFNKTETDATTGNIGRTAIAVNTVIPHLDTLDQAATALKNGDVRAMNRIANFVGAQTGSTAKTTYDTIVHRIGPELTKAYLASGGTVGERGTNEADFSSSLSPDQIKSNIKESVVLLGSKVDAMTYQYQQGTYGQGQRQLISPAVQATRQRLAGPASQAPPAAAGATHRYNPKTNRIEAVVP